MARDGRRYPAKLLKPATKFSKSLRHQTGGRVFFPYKVDDLAYRFQDIGTELRSQYFIAYSPTNLQSTGKYRTIEVQTDRKGSTFAPAKVITLPPRLHHSRLASELPPRSYQNFKRFNNSRTE